MLYNRYTDFTVGTTINSEEVDTELNRIAGVLNGQIDATNIADGSITVDKLESAANPEQVTRETNPDIITSGLGLVNVKGVVNCAYTNREESIASGVAYIRGVRAVCDGGSKTYDASSTTWVYIKQDGTLDYVVSATEPSPSYIGMLIYRVVTDATKITQIDAMGFNDVGTVIPFAGKTAPKGYLICQGGEFSRTTYNKLFNVIQAYFGTPSSAAVFKVPDMRQSVPYGLGTSPYDTFGAKGGEANHTHGMSDHIHGVSHAHSGRTGYDAPMTYSGNANWAHYGTGNSPPSHYHGLVIDTNWFNSGGPSTNTSGTRSAWAPYVTMNYIIKAE